MKQLVMMIFILLVYPGSYAAVILPLQINKTAEVTNGEFSEDFLVTTGRDIHIILPNNDDIPSSDIEVTLPDGTIVNSLNSESHGFTFTSHTVDHELKALVAPFDAWIIDSSNAPLGTYTVRGSSAASRVPISLRILDSNIHFKLFVGEPGKGVYSGKSIPISLYLNESNTHLTTATVLVDIYKDTDLVESFSIKDDGNDTDMTGGDGHYDLITNFESAGVYRVMVEISGTNSNGMLYEGKFTETVSVKDEKLFVDLNFIETVTDEDNDGYKDELIISFPYTGFFSESDYFYFYGKLNIGDDYLESHEKILASSGELLLKFQGEKIRELDYSGTFNLEFVRVDLNGRYLKSFHELKATQYYSKDAWERDDLIYIGNFTEEPIDKDNNNIYEGLNFKFEVDTVPVGDFGYSIGFYTEEGIDMGLFGNQPVAFTLGNNTVETYLPASKFSSLGVDSKIEAKHLLMYGLNDLGGFLRIKSLGFSKQYSCWDFAGCENGPNTPPQAINDSVSSNGTAVEINVTSNDIDVDGDLIKVNSVTQPQNGTAKVVGNFVRYTPNEGFAGEDTFAYEIMDIYTSNNVWKRGSDSGTVTVTVTSH
ncbi:Ig-like domain-containing protein [Kangiella koreensis]|uniref:Proprotein convertase, P n=1 Tax=Kangiella koreensis (strain DSM 16069 / JCM 12317 / KCTC 12182 / SW-125) TaxID=523791 RepID=C7RD19_KANKD|nr:Ig-like domain-containing protein [Kangiella koreensis]ACV27161.1 proprotein convertase, P [Kangiella koreensis DSM 16069]